MIIAAEAVTPLSFLPAYAAFGLGLFSRRRALTVAAGALVALHLKWVLPELRPARPLAAAAGSAPLIRIFSANLKYTNTRMAPMAEEIRETGPDIVLFQELSPANLDALRATGVLDGFEFSLTQPRLMPTGSGVFSHLTLSDAEPWDVGGMINARVTVTVGDHKVRIYDVHTNAPFGAPGAPGAPRWEHQLAEVRRAVMAEEGPLVVAGDFNASYGHRGFRALLEAGLRDAHTERGRGWATTWPRDLRVIPAFVRLDHVLVSDQLAVVGIAEGVGKGSDHRPLIADLAITG